MKTSISALLLTLPACFTLACGDLPADTHEAAIDDLGEPAAAAPSADAQVLAVHQQTALVTAAQVAASPAFGVLSQGAYVRLGDMLAVKAGMTQAELAATYAIVERCSGNANHQACQDLVDDAGFTTALTSAEVSARNALNTAYHLDQMAVPARVALLRDAQAIYVSNTSNPQPPLSLVPSTFDNGQYACDATCKADVIAGLATAHAGAVAFLTDPDSQQQTAGFFVLLPIIVDVVKALGEFGWACYISPDCCLWPFEDCDNDECTANNDCDSDEYCWRAPFGTGNECRTLKENSEPCGHDYACESGCCNFNLFGSNCATPNKCN